jgi:hypothetical protein
MRGRGGPGIGLWRDRVDEVGTAKVVGHAVRAWEWRARIASPSASVCTFSRARASAILGDVHVGSRCGDRSHR